MNRTDEDALHRDALTRAIEQCRAEDAGRAKQIDHMLADKSRSWEEVGIFAATCVQSTNLGLLPWQLPPFRASLRDLDKPYGDTSGRRESAELLKRLHDSGLSVFEPDPLAALAKAEQRRAAKG